jgi:hypothetical protein
VSGTSHSEAFQSGGRATNKHFVNFLRGGSFAFHDTSDKFVTSNDAFYGGNALIAPSPLHGPPHGPSALSWAPHGLPHGPPPPRSDPNFRLVNGDRELGRELPVAMTWEGGRVCGT